MAMDRHDEIAAADASLRDGFLVGFPTDTVYGIAASPYREDSLDRLNSLKGERSDKPFALLVASIEQAMALAEFTDQALDLADRHWPGGLTLVLPKLRQAPEWLGSASRDTIGLRCPDHPLGLELLETAGPLIVTSANRSEEPPAVDDATARAIFGDHVAVYLPGVAPGGTPSTVIDLTQPEPLVLRPGPVEAG